MDPKCSPMKRRKRKVEIKDAEPEEFRNFLDAITPAQTMIINPWTVRGLVKLADRYQVDFVKERCVQHLKHCVEIPLMERLIMADTCGPEQLKQFIFSIDADQLRAFCKAHCAELRDSKQLSLNLFKELFLSGL